MKFRFLEPANHKYLWVNPKTNTVHFLVPMVAGKDIALDNTCQQFAENNNFDRYKTFLLTEYKQKILVDLEFLAEGEEKRLKKDRLAQVEHYIKICGKISNQYSTFRSYVNPKSNLQSVQINSGTSANFSSPTYTRSSAMQIPYINAVILGTPRERFTKKALASFAKRRLPANCKLIIDEIIKELNATHKQMFGDHYKIDFSLTNEEIGFLGYDNVTAENVDSKPELDALIKAMIGKAREEIDFPPESVFRTNNTIALGDATSFLLAEINVYCRARDLSSVNFGNLLQNNSNLSNRLVNKIKDTIIQDGSVESMICNFINENAQAFGLKTQITGEQIKAISQRFDGHYRTTRSAHHKNEILILETDVKDKTTFLSHQNCICLDASYLISSVGTRAKNEVKNLPAELPIKEANSVGYVEMDIEQFKKFIIKAIKENNAIKLQTIFSISEKNTSMFEELGRGFFSQFDNNAQAYQLFNSLLPKIHDAAVTEKFDQIVRNTTQAIVTSPLISSLQIALAVKRNTTITNNANIQNLLDGLNIVYSKVSVIKGITCIDLPKQQLEKINQLIKTYSNQSFISTKVEDSLYKQVGLNFGRGGTTYANLEKLPIKSDNKQAVAPKLIKALELLKINIKPEDISLNNKGEKKGYLIKNTNHKIQQQLNEIHAKQEKYFILNHTLVKALYAKITHKADIAILNKFTDVHKIQVALNLMGMQYVAIEKTGKDEYLLTLPTNQPDGQIYLKKLVNIPLDAEEQKKFPSFKNALRIEVNKKIQQLPAKRATLGPNSERGKIQIMLNELINNIKTKKNHRHTWFNLNTDSKVNKLEAILSWVSEKDNELTEPGKNLLLGLIHDVCALKRNAIGWFNPHSMAEFQTLAQSLKIDLANMDRAERNGKSLNMLETSATAIDDLLAQQLERNQSEPRA